MFTKPFIRTGIALVGLMIAGAFIACNKGELQSPSSFNAPSDDEIRNPKREELFMLYNVGTNGTFTVLNSAGCYYGKTYVGNVYIGNFSPSGDGIRSMDGECNYPSPNSLLFFKLGSTPGSLGPVYYILPSQAHGTSYTALKIQARNVSGASAPAYNTKFSYNPATDSWSWNSYASTYFSFTVIANYYRSACPIKEK